MQMLLSSLPYLAMHGIITKLCACACVCVCVCVCAPACMHVRTCVRVRVLLLRVLTGMAL